MGIVKDIIGLSLIIVAWINPFGADMIIRMLMFFLGFELMEMFVKMSVLALCVFFPQTFGYMLPVFLAGIFVLEVVLKFVVTGLIVGFILRPIVLFVASLLISHAPLPSALIGVADLIIVVLGAKFKL